MCVRRELRGEVHTHMPAMGRNSVMKFTRVLCPGRGNPEIELLAVIGAAPYARGIAVGGRWQPWQNIVGAANERIASPCSRRASLVLALEALSPRTACLGGIVRRGDHNMGSDSGTSPLGKFGPPRRDRLYELLALAQTYRGWSHRELAEFLGRDPHNLIPQSGVPKLDLVVRLAEALDWPIQDVVADLCQLSETIKSTQERREGEDFAALHRSAYEAYLGGRYEAMLSLSRRARVVAETGDERAWSWIREAGAWDGLGHFALSQEAVTRGLQEAGLRPLTLLTLRGNLANSYLSLGHYTEAEGIATANLALLNANPDLDCQWPGARAFVLYVRGCARRMAAIISQSGAERPLLMLAAEDLQDAVSLYQAISSSQSTRTYGGIGHTCEGALMTVEALAGDRAVEETLRAMHTALDRVVEVDRAPAGDWLESYGWWCIFACQLASRTLSDPDQLDRYLAIFTNKAHEIAERTGSWTLRERVFSLEHFRKQQAFALSEPGRTLDAEDLRILTGAMGRFPLFRQRGWELIRTSSMGRDVTAQ